MDIAKITNNLEDLFDMMLSADEPSVCTENVQLINDILWNETREFLNSVSLMRRYQKAYFNSKMKGDLIKAKEYEKKVDDTLMFLQNQKRQPQIKFS